MSSFVVLLFVVLVFHSFLTPRRFCPMMSMQLESDISCRFHFQLKC